MIFLFVISKLIYRFVNIEMMVLKNRFVQWEIRTCFTHVYNFNLVLTYISFKNCIVFIDDVKFQETLEYNQQCDEFVGLSRQIEVNNPHICQLWLSVYYGE